MGQNCNYLANNANISSKRPNLAVCMQKILLLKELSKRFSTQLTEEPPRHLVHNVFGQALDQMGQKGRYLAKNASYEQNLQEIAPRLHGLHAHKMDCKTRQSEAMEE